MRILRSISRLRVGTAGGPQLAEKEPEGAVDLTEQNVKHVQRSELPPNFFGLKSCVFTAVYAAFVYRLPPLTEKRYRDKGGPTQQNSRPKAADTVYKERYKDLQKVSAAAAIAGLGTGKQLRRKYQDE